MCISSEYVNIVCFHLLSVSASFRVNEEAVQEPAQRQPRRILRGRRNLVGSGDLAEGSLMQLSLGSSGVLDVGRSVNSVATPGTGALAVESRRSSASFRVNEEAVQEPARQPRRILRGRRNLVGSGDLAEGSQMQLSLGSSGVLDVGRSVNSVATPGTGALAVKSRRSSASFRVNEEAVQEPARQSRRILRGRRNLVGSGDLAEASLMQLSLGSSEVLDVARSLSSAAAEGTGALAVESRRSSGKTISLLLAILWIAFPDI
ncbi:unnamed protein product [Dicrocoelium dendriticum]|nr:unnamed protein product [Dicrocoelium dendriticum]